VVYDPLDIRYPVSGIRYPVGSGKSLSGNIRYPVSGKYAIRYIPTYYAPIYRATSVVESEVQMCANLWLFVGICGIFMD
jgi:hypothetical protein